MVSRKGVLRVVWERRNRNTLEEEDVCRIIAKKKNNRNFCFIVTFSDKAFFSGLFEADQPKVTTRGLRFSPTY